VVEVPLVEQADFDLDPNALAAMVRPGDLVWIGRPNNPTGRCPAAALVAGLAAARPTTWWAVDEAFLDFVDGARSVAGLGLGNLITVRSMTKFYALPGLRLGYAVLPGALAARGRELLPDWSVSTPAQAAGAAALTDPALGRFAQRTQALVQRERGVLVGTLRGLGAAVVEGAANYLLLRLPTEAPTGAAVAARLLRESGIAVRTCSGFTGLGARHLRVAVRGPAENARLLAALSAVVGRPGC
jgi:histidinol-phosphate/aromatic aminotransferase/cobyric acid decarboxylase-like protein